jgi:hypothetical protein
MVVDPGRETFSLESGEGAIIPGMAAGCFGTPGSRGGISDSSRAQFF